MLILRQKEFNDSKKLSKKEQYGLGALVGSVPGMLVGSTIGAIKGKHKASKTTKEDQIKEQKTNIEQTKRRLKDLEQEFENAKKHPEIFDTETPEEIKEELEIMEYGVNSWKEYLNNDIKKLDQIQNDWDNYKKNYVKEKAKDGSLKGFYKGIAIGSGVGAVGGRVAFNKLYNKQKKK